MGEIDQENEKDFKSIGKLSSKIGVMDIIGKDDGSIYVEKIQC